MTDTDDNLHRQMVLRDAMLGMGAGGLAGNLMARHLAPGSQLAAIGVPMAMMMQGGALGSMVGKERALTDQAKTERHEQDSMRAHEQRKELLNMRKSASYEAIKLAAMADELRHIEKVAINLAPVTSALGNFARRAAPMVENLGSRVVRGAEALGHAGMGATSQVAQRMGQGAITGLNMAEGALGGAKNLNRAMGAGTLAVGGLAGAGLARAALPGQQQTRR